MNLCVNVCDSHQINCRQNLGVWVYERGSLLPQSSCILSFKVFSVYVYKLFFSCKNNGWFALTCKLQRVNLLGTTVCCSELILRYMFFKNTQLLFWFFTGRSYVCLPSVALGLLLIPTHAPQLDGGWYSHLCWVLMFGIQCFSMRFSRAL